MASTWDVSSDALPVIDPSTSRMLPADMFISDTVRQKLKGCTNLLQRCEAVTRKQDRGKVLDITNEAGKKQYRKLYNPQQRRINLLIRSGEVAAGGITNAECAEDEDGQIYITNQGKIVLSINAVGKDGHKNNKQNPTTKVFISANIEPATDLDPDADVVSHVLQQYRASRKKGLGIIRFQDHVACFIPLLRNCWSAESKVKQAEAIQRLKTYVYTVSHPKMLRRLELGQEQHRKFFQALRLVPSSSEEFKERIQNDPIPDKPFLKSAPTATQLQILEQFYEDIGQSGKLENAKNEPVYSTRNRTILQLLLSTCLESANKALSTLKESMNFSFINKARKFEEAIGKEDQIKRNVEAAERSITRLSMILEAFDGPPEQSVLMEHLEWLARASGVWPGQSKEDDQSGDGGNMDVDADKPTIGSTGDDEHGGFAPDATDPMNLDEPPEGFQPGNDDEGDELDEKVTSLAAMRLDDQGKAHAMRKYLQLICLHELGLTEEANAIRLPAERNTEQDREASLILNSKVVVVDIRCGKRDTECWSMNECLDELVPRDSGLRRDTINQILGGVKDHNEDKYPLLERKTYDGSMHCECILLCLAYLVHHEDYSKLLTKEWLEHNGIFATRSDLIKLFRGLLPFLAVSKRNCPYCTIICKHIIETGVLKGSKEFVMPGLHTKWYAATLPVFLPKPIAQKVLEEVELEVLQRLRNLQAVYDQSTSSDPRSEQSHPGSTPAGKSKAFPAQQTFVGQEDLDILSSPSNKRAREESQVGGEEQARIEHGQFDNDPA